MADKAIPQLSTLEDPQKDDVLIIVDDANSNPVNKKIRVDNLLSALATDTSTRSVANKVVARSDAYVQRDINFNNERILNEPEFLGGELNDLTLSHVDDSYLYISGQEGELPFWDIRVSNTFIDGNNGTNPTANDKFTVIHYGNGSSDTGTPTSPATITDNVAISNTFSVQFASGTGHRVGDRWRITTSYESKIDFSHGQLLLEDGNKALQGTFRANFSELGTIQLENGLDIQLESTAAYHAEGQDPNTSATREHPALHISANSQTINITGDVVHDGLIVLTEQTNTPDDTGSFWNHTGQVNEKGFIYAQAEAGSAEVYVMDEAKNVTKISPHNDQGEWEYYSRNIKTGKVMRVNMERMIRKLEEITGETFIEEV